MAPEEYTYLHMKEARTPYLLLVARDGVIEGRIKHGEELPVRYLLSRGFTGKDISALAEAKMLTRVVDVLADGAPLDWLLAFHGETP